MTKQEILELLKASKWTPSGSKLFVNDEFSETLAIWNKEHAFTVHCVRIKEHEDNMLLVVTRVRPKLKFDIEFEAIEPILNDSSTKYMLTEQLLNNKEEHNDLRFIEGIA